ncbi:MAG TPA: EamA family transporter [Candidatus Nanoarchaeia archaeon]|nr:EamA family transporter [Candidatus Nanoarchaeia archaeon]
MSRTEPWAIALVIGMTALTALGQLLYKMGADRITGDIFSVLLNWQLILGLAIYALAALLLLIAFRGGELSVLYPLVATSYVWVGLLSMYFLGEAMNSFKWLGILFIILGVSSIGRGSR